VTIRTVNVEARVSIAYQIDDEAVSDWDGAKILEVFEKRKDNDPPVYGVYNEETAQDDLLGYLGIEIGVNNRRMGNIDGWADFPESAATFGGVHWNIDSVEVR
jgi:hypothetical protein